MKPSSKTNAVKRFCVTRNTYGTNYFVEETNTCLVAASFNTRFVSAAETRAIELCKELNASENHAKGTNLKA